MIEIIRVLSILGLRHFSGALYGLIRSKLLAYFIGPLGVGIFSQARTFMQFLEHTTSFGSKGGVLKILTDLKADADRSKLPAFIAGVMVFFGSVATSVSIVCFIFSQRIAIWVFDDGQYAWVIQIVAVSVVFFLENSLIYIIFQGLSKWNRFIRIAITGDIVSTILTSVAIIFWNLQGAIFSFLLCTVALFSLSFIALNRVFKEEGFHLFGQAAFSFQPVRKLMRFIGPLFTKAFAEYAGLLSLRSEIIRQLGINASGIFQVVYGTSLVYMEIFSQMLISYGIPKLTANLHSSQEMNKIQNNLLRLGLIILAPATLLLLLSRQIWIPLLYDYSFMSAAPALLWQFSGDLLRVIRTSISASLLSQERFWVININEIFYWAAWIIFTIILIPYTGIIAASIGYFLTNLILTPVVAYYHSKHLGYRLSKQSVFLLLKAIPLVVIGFYFANQPVVDLRVILATIAVVICMLLFLPSKKDYRETLQIINKYRNEH